MTSKFVSAVHQKVSCTTKDDPRRDPSWGKAEKLKNLKMKTIRPKTWHGLRQDGAVLLNEVPLQASLREHISSATAPHRIRAGCTASMPLPGRVPRAFSVTFAGSSW